MKQKFRAWHKELKKMFDVKSLVFTICTATIASRDDIVPSRNVGFDELILMQSTGLVDKNGVEIFEGDVVKVFDKDLYVVEWSSQEAYYKLIPVDRQLSDCYFSNYENITKIIEVVGNIWEDGELLDS